MVEVYNPESPHYSLKMTRARESGAYLGGIGTMLGETRSCQVCGGVHESHPYGFQHRGSGSCPLVVAEDFAVISLVDGETDQPEHRHEELTAALPRSDLPVSFGTIPMGPSPSSTPAPRSLEVPWLRPPDLSEVV
jgi:hypothetical protein